ncbi:MAG TPA: complex I subunit 1 family protein [Desulfomicrobiaceae bacterium]|nr:complex I subunit 1 family protein [Desulfomicrobiaceae bacterium]
MSETLSYIFHLLIFPGGLFALLFGLLLKGIDRKVFARLQRRIGPPLLQPLFDVIKLGRKETLIPATAHKGMFRFAPVLGFMGAMVAAMFIPVPGVWDGAPGLGDMLMLLYLLPIPAVALILAGSSSSSPFGALGASREMILMFAYEIPLLVVLLTVALRVGYATGGVEFSLARVVEYQLAHGSFLLDPVMLPAFAAYLLFIPGTMGSVPFDLAEAETEILEGPLLEYSGPSLAMFQLMFALKMVVVTGLGVVLFFPGTLGTNPVVNLAWFCCKATGLMLVAVTLLRASTGRLRTDQTFRFYLKYPTGLAYAGLGLTWILG